MAITSRKPGTAADQVIRTIGASGCDYTSVATWEGNTTYVLTGSNWVYTGSTSDGTGFAHGNTFGFYAGASYIGAADLIHPMLAADGSRTFSVVNLDSSGGSGNWAGATVAKLSGDLTRTITITGTKSKGVIEIGRIK